VIVVEMNLQSALSNSRDRHLGSIRISNDGKPTNMTRHNYDVEVLGVKGQTIRRGRLENWPRDSKSPMQLLGAALDACGY
jgi:hypothetical protein